MRAVVCHRSELEVTEVPDPVPGPGQLLLRVLRCGICGSDLHARRHADQLHEAAAATGYDAAMAPDDHVVLGHELVGEVLEAAPGFAVGDRVVALPLLRRDGRTHMVGLSEPATGGYAELALAEAAVAMKVPDGVPDAHAALTEPLAVALHAVRRSGVGRRDVAIVIGCGPIGLAVVSALKASGVRTVVASDLSEGRREKARACGADVVVDPRETSPWEAYDTGRYHLSGQGLMDFAVETMGTLRRVPRLPWWHVMRVAELAGQLPSGPVVFECVGTPGMIDHVVAHAPLASRVVVVGVCMEPDTFRPSIAINKEIDLRFVFCYTPREFHETLQLLAKGELHPEVLLTGEVGLDGVAGAFDALADPGQHAKIMVDPSRPGTEVALL